MDNHKNELREMTITFAIEVSDLCDDIKGCRSYVDQIVRSSSSIGANLYEARYAQSRADFISKLEIALKECSETEYWLELLHRKQKMTDGQFKALNNTRGDHSEKTHRFNHNCEEKQWAVRDSLKIPRLKEVRTHIAAAKLLRGCCIYKRLPYKRGEKEVTAWQSAGGAMPFSATGGAWRRWRRPAGRCWRRRSYCFCG